jgi:hypothetical protein
MSETELLLHASRVRPDAETVARLSTSVDAESFAWLAKRHGVAALCARALTAAGAKPEVTATVERLAAPIRLRTLELTASLARLHDALAIASVPYVSLKGPALAVMAFPSLGLRTFRDLDLLVRPRDWRATASLLAGLGYIPGFPSQLLELAAAGHAPPPDVPFWSPDRDLELDLHVASSRPWLDLPIDPSDPALLTTVRVGGRDVPTLNPTRTLVYLAVHGAKHGWERLAWLTDIAFLLDAHPEARWDDAITWASETGTSRLLNLGVGLARALLAAPIPPALAAAFEADRSVMALVRQLTDEAPGIPWEDRSRLDRAQFQWRSREQWRDRVRWAWMRLFEPTLDDFRAAPRFARAARPWRLARNILSGTGIFVGGCLPGDPQGCVWRSSPTGALICHTDVAGEPVQWIRPDAPQIAAAVVMDDADPATATRRLDALATNAARNQILLIGVPADATAAAIVDVIDAVAAEDGLGAPYLWAGFGAGAERLTGELVPQFGGTHPGPIVANCGGLPPGDFAWEPSLATTAAVPVYFAGGDVDGDLTRATDGYRAAGFEIVELAPLSTTTRCDPAEDWSARTIGHWTAFRSRLNAEP